jgi:hypothetical protein
LRVVIVAVFKDLALDGGIFAAEQEDERRVPAREGFYHSDIYHPGALRAVKLRKTGWGNEPLRRMAARVFVAQDGGQRPEVVGAVRPEPVVGSDGRNGVVDDRGKTRQRERGLLESMRVCGTGGRR